MADQQIHGGSLHSRSPTRRAGRLGREHPRGDPATAAATLLHDMIGPNQQRARDVEHLASGGADDRRVILAGATAVAWVGATQRRHGRYAPRSHRKRRVAYPASGAGPRRHRHGRPCDQCVLRHAVRDGHGHHATAAATSSASPSSGWLRAHRPGTQLGDPCRLSFDQHCLLHAPRLDHPLQTQRPPLPAQYTGAPTTPHTLSRTARTSAISRAFRASPYTS